jgi:hypothetical protein
MKIRPILLHLLELRALAALWGRSDRSAEWTGWSLLNGPQGRLRGLQKRHNPLIRLGPIPARFAKIAS